MGAQPPPETVAAMQTTLREPQGWLAFAVSVPGLFEGGPAGTVYELRSGEYWFTLVRTADRQLLATYRAPATGTRQAAVSLDALPPADTLQVTFAWGPDEVTLYVSTEKGQPVKGVGTMPREVVEAVMRRSSVIQLVERVGRRWLDNGVTRRRAAKLRSFHDPAPHPVIEQIARTAYPSDEPDLAYVSDPGVTRLAIAARDIVAAWPILVQTRASERKLIADIRDERQFETVAFEAKVADRLQRCGYTVAGIVPTAGGRTPDFAVEVDGTRVDVECKTRDKDQPTRDFEWAMTEIADAVVRRFGKGTWETRIECHTGIPREVIPAIIDAVLTCARNGREMERTFADGEVLVKVSHGRPRTVAVHEAGVDLHGLDEARKAGWEVGYTLWNGKVEKDADHEVTIAGRRTQRPAPFAALPTVFGEVATQLKDSACGLAVIGLGDALALPLARDQSLSAEMLTFVDATVVPLFREVPHVAGVVVLTSLFEVTRNGIYEEVELVAGRANPSARQPLPATFTVNPPDVQIVQAVPGSV